MGRAEAPMGGFLGAHGRDCCFYRFSSRNPWEIPNLSTGMLSALPPFLLAMVPGKQATKSKRIGEYEMNGSDRKYVHKEDKDKGNHAEWSGNPTVRESIRFAARCSGRPRRPQDCSCGRRRALVRIGHRWRRLSACWHCLEGCKRVGLALKVKEVPRV